MGPGKEPRHGEDPSPKTFIDKINASASGLAQSALGGPSTANEILGSYANQGNKGESSSASDEGHAPNIRNPEYLHASGYVNKEQASEIEGFRSVAKGSKSDAQRAQAAFHDFTKPPQGILAECDEVADGRHPTDPALYYISGARVVLGEPPYDGSLSEIKQSVAGQQGYGDQDGAAVVALLSNPSFSADDAPGDFQDQVRDDDEKVLDFRGLSEGGSLKKSQTGYFLPADDFVWSSEDHKPWQDLLDRYHDEVWGDKLPFVKEARKELQKAMASGDANPVSGPAFQRLRLLLGHMKSLP